MVLFLELVDPMLEVGCGSLAQVGIELLRTCFSVV